MVRTNQCSCVVFKFGLEMSYYITIVCLFLSCLHKNNWKLSEKNQVVIHVVYQENIILR